MVWEQLEGLGRNDGKGPVDIANIFRAMANTPTPVHIYKFIRPPSIRGTKMDPYSEEYHNIVVSTVTDGETIEVGTMEVLKQITVNYTHLTRGGANQLLNTKQTLGTRNSGENPPQSYN